MSIEPMNGRVVVKELPEPTTAGFVAVTSEKPTKGEVVAVSPDSRLKLGDIVLYARESGVGISVGDIPHVLLREQEIYAKITDQ